MNHLLVVLVVFSPLVGFLINGILGKKLPEKLSGALGTLAVMISFISSVLLWNHVRIHGGFETVLFNWLAIDTLVLDFGFRVDALSIWMMLIISGIGTLIHLYSIGYMHGDKGFSRFFAYLNLFVFSMFLLVMGNNLVVLFFGWEGVGLCSYLLIGFWYHNIAYGHAARKAFIMNRIGDLGLLLGIFLIFKVFGTLHLATIAELASANLVQPQIINWITFLLFIGAMGKSAQIPLYTWLPDAMAGPTPVSALIHAATMVTAGIYLVVRNANLYQIATLTTQVILIIGLATSILAALIGLYQNDIKKVLAYSTVSQLGLMFVALGVGAYSTAMFHLTTHAFFKALLFLGAGSVIHAMGGEQNISFMGGLKNKIKTTHITFLIGTLAIIGFPLFSGFFSKDEILEKVFEYSPIVWGFTLFSAALTAIYMLRLYFVVFLGNFRGSETQKANLHESPITMTLPLMILALLSLIGGALNLPHFLPENMSQFLSHWIAAIPSMQFLAPTSHAHHLSQPMIFGLMGLAIALVLVLLFLVYRFYASRQFNILPNQSKFSKLGENKFFVDEIYNHLFVKQIEARSEFLYQVSEKKAVKPFIMFFAQIFGKLGKVFQKVQDGNVENYLLYFVLGIISFILLILL